MGKYKTTYKIFSIMQREKEQAYLSKMQEKGWKLAHISGLCAYHFEKCTPEAVTYQLDYQKEGINDEYLQMFADCGWEYILSFWGYHYFRKQTALMESGDEEIFCDAESRLDMMKRVFRGRLLPLVAVFCCCVLPQSVAGFLTREPSVGKALWMCLLILFLIYSCIFLSFGLHYLQYKRKVRGEEPHFKLKYYGLLGGGIAIIALVLFLTVGKLAGQRASDYTVSAEPDWYCVAANYLDEEVTHDWELQEGDRLSLSMVVPEGKIHVSIGIPGEDPIYEGNMDKMHSSEVTVTKTGTYRILVRGDHASGSYSFTLNE